MEGRLVFMSSALASLEIGNVAARLQLGLKDEPLSRGRKRLFLCHLSAEIRVLAVWTWQKGG